MSAASSGVNSILTLHRYIGHQSGRRSDTAHSYIYNKGQNANLVILTGKRVKRVLFEGITVCGVECVDEEGSIAQVSVFKAVRLVVLSAGAFGSPTILERYILPISRNKSTI